jgi:hypothetical protein
MTWLLVADSYLVGLGTVVALVVYPAFEIVGMSGLAITNATAQRLRGL